MKTRCNTQLANFKKTNLQNGVVLIIFIFFIALAATAYLLHVFNPTQFKNKQNQETLQALAVAKQALLAHAIDQITATPRNPTLLKCEDKNSNGLIDSGDLPYTPKNCNCTDNCPRPADLPCTDKQNDGEAETACGASVSNRLGRLPWKTLGTGDLRDGTGERLWYAVSNQYKNNQRLLPLNSQTVGGISLMGLDGNLINDASAGNGVVAVIIAAQSPIIRYESNGAKTSQVRSSANENNPAHYLEVALNEDNAGFIDGGQNGFISGIYKQMQGNQAVIISNDIILPIYQNEIANLSKTFVLSEVAKALKNDIDILPSPSSPVDLTCKGYGEIEEGSCKEDVDSFDGYIPVSQGASPAFTGWQTKNVNSILRGDNNSNWFQQNGWRELVRYQKNAPCLANEKWCRNIDSQITVRID